MPEKTREERKTKEEARLLWAKQLRQLQSIAAAQARKNRIAARQYYYYPYRPQIQWKTIAIYTPAGNMYYRVPY